jgi:hypothetical protein
MVGGWGTNCLRWVGGKRKGKAVMQGAGTPCARGGGGGCHDAQKLDHCLFVCPELKFSSSISNSGFWIRNKPVCGQASPSKSKTNYICCCYMERWRVGGGWKPLVLTCMPHTLWKKTRSRAYPNHCTQSQYSSSASCRRAAGALCREGGRRRGSDGNRDGELRVVVVVVGSTMMCVNGEVIVVVVRVAALRFINT